MTEPAPKPHQNWTQLLIAIVVTVGVIVEFYHERGARLERAEVKQKLVETTEKTTSSLAENAESLEDLTIVTDQNHKLLNSNMGTQLKISAVALRRIAAMNPGNADDKAAAELAEKELKEHEAKQAQVDREEKRSP